jgi:hypothetical protein
MRNDAQRLLINNFDDDVPIILKDKNDNDPVFTSEKNISVALHRITLFKSNIKICIRGIS